MDHLLEGIVEPIAELVFVGLLYGGLGRAYRLIALPEDAYHRPVLLAELARRPAQLLVAVGPALPALCNPSLSWGQLAGAAWLRPFICALLAWISLASSTYAFNWYLRRWHLVDRGVLLLLGLASAFHPGFVVLVAAWAVVLTGQFIHPIFPADRAYLSTYTHRLPLVHQLLLFHAYLCATSILDLPPARFMTLALVAQGAHYFHSALGKLRLQWLQRDELVGLLCAAVAHGWWPHRNGSAPRRLGLWMQRANRPLLIACLAVELGGGLLLIHANLAIVLLVALAGLHVAILVLIGINFLPWIFLDLCLALAVGAQPAETFGLLPFAVSLPFLAVAPKLFGVHVLAWLDARLCNAYRFEAVAVDGQRYELSPDAFAPYDMIMAFGKFRFLSDEPLLVDVWSESSEASVVQAIARTRTLRDINALEQHFGKNYFSQRRTQRMHRFLEEFLRSLSTRRSIGAGSWFARDWLARGAHTATLTTRDVQAIAVRIVKLLYAGGEFRLLEDRVLDDVVLAKEHTASPPLLRREGGPPPGPRVGHDGNARARKPADPGTG